MYILAVGIAGSYHLEVLMKLDRFSIQGSITHHFLDGPNCLCCVGLIKEQHCVDGTLQHPCHALLHTLLRYLGQCLCLLHFPLDVTSFCASMYLIISKDFCSDEYTCS